MGFLDKVIRFFEEITTNRGSVDVTSEATSEGEDNVSGWYLSGLQYSRDIGVIIYGDYGIDEAEAILREYAEESINNYNDGFYGIGEIGYDGSSPLDEVIEVGL